MALEGQATPTELAIEKVKDILEASIGTDEDLSEAIADTNLKALDSVQAFLKKMADNGAICALEFKGDEFRFRDVGQVRRSENRLRGDNIHEIDVTLIGQFQGFLPNSRRAEILLIRTDADFLHEAVGTVISGRVDQTVDEKIKINETLGQAMTILARTRRVGQGRPRYVFIDCQMDSQ